MDIRGVIMGIPVQDSGVQKDTQSIPVRDSGTDKETQEVIVRENGTDKVAFSATEPWDVGSLSFNARYFAGNRYVGVCFRPDGTNMFLKKLNYNSNTVDEGYDLSTAWDINTAALDDTQTESETARGLQLNETHSPGYNYYAGEIRYRTDYISDSLYSKQGPYKWDLTLMDSNLLSYDLQGNTSVYFATPYGFHFTDGGTRFYVVAQNSYKVYHFTLSTAWEGGLSRQGDVLSRNADGNQLQSVFCKEDGTKLYVVISDGTGTAKVKEYALSTPFNLDTATEIAELDMSGQTTNALDIWWKPDGTRLYITTRDGILEYIM